MTDFGWMQIHRDLLDADKASVVCIGKRRRGKR
jgi:hypothetical protein